MVESTGGLGRMPWPVCGGKKIPKCRSNVVNCEGTLSTGDISVMFMITSVGRSNDSGKVWKSLVRVATVDTRGICGGVIGLFKTNTFPPHVGVKQSQM